jgi:hypothetical protein
MWYLVAEISQKQGGLWYLTNASFNNISVISWQSVLLVKEIGVLGENHRPAVSHNIVSSTPRPSRIRTHNVSGNRH